MNMMSLADAPLYELPDVVHDLIVVIDVPAALAIVERYRGIRLCLPIHERSINPDHPLAQLIGIDRARALVRAHRGRPPLAIPRCVAAMRAVRNREICRRHAEDGWTAARLAQWASLTERQVYTILAAPSEDDNQATLF